MSLSFCKVLVQCPCFKCLHASLPVCPFTHCLSHFFTSGDVYMPPVCSTATTTTNVSQPCSSACLAPCSSMHAVSHATACFSKNAHHVCSIQHTTPQVFMVCLLLFFFSFLHPCCSSSLSFLRWRDEHGGGGGEVLEVERCKHASSSQTRG